MNARFMARTDWREEGAFRPNQFPPGSDARKEYEAEQAIIEQQEAESHEHSDIDSRQERNRQERIVA